MTGILMLCLWNVSISTYKIYYLNSYSEYFSDIA